MRHSFFSLKQVFHPLLILGFGVVKYHNETNSKQGKLEGAHNWKNFLVYK